MAMTQPIGDNQLPGPLLEDVAKSSGKRAKQLRTELEEIRAYQAQLARTLLDRGYGWKQTAELLGVSLRTVQEMIRRTGGR